MQTGNSYLEDQFYFFTFAIKYSYVLWQKSPHFYNWFFCIAKLCFLLLAFLFSVTVSALISMMALPCLFSILRIIFTSSFFSFSFHDSLSVWKYCNTYKTLVWATISYVLPVLQWFLSITVLFLSFVFLSRLVFPPPVQF